MRTSHTARLAAAIALALASQTYAATAVTTPRATVIGNGTLITSSPGVPASANAAPANTGNTTTNTTTNTSTQPANATNVDVRNLQTQQAVAGTHASGSTSALGPLANGNASVNSPTTAGTGTTSGAGATGTGSSTSTAAGAAAGIPAFPTLGGAATLGTGGVVGVPLVASGDLTSGMATTTQGNTVFANGLAANDVNAGAVLSPDVTFAANAAANGVSVDRAISQVSRDRKRVGRNGQLLYSIAPRTNGVDRTNQMPDDGPSPALTGSNSALTR